MSSFCWSVWLIGSALIFLGVTLGLALLSQMALTTTGHVAPPPWGALLAGSAGLVFYWSALCWALALARKQPIISVAIVAVALLVAFVYPAIDRMIYDSQRAAAAKAALYNGDPQWAGKTALLIWPKGETCQHACYNIAAHSEARFYLLVGQEARAVDFSETVDITRLRLRELKKNEAGLLVALPVAQAPQEIDLVVIHGAQDTALGGPYEHLRPWGIGADRLALDAVVASPRAGRYLELGNDQELIRMLSVSRPLASTPFVPFAGPRNYWNSVDRRRNYERIRAGFCTAPDREARHWCNNAFD